jgi:acetyl-CoA carboxylase carboxyltransferase component
MSMDSGDDMNGNNAKIKDLERRRAVLLSMGEPDQVAKQHAKGKLTARERIAAFFDQGTFMEVDAFVEHRSTQFDLGKVSIPSDGVITGHGLVEGRTVFAFFQDFTARGGSLGEMHAQKIYKIQDMALKAGCPLVGFNDSGGARIQEGIDSLKGYGEIFFRNARASGVIPQISAILGPCAGGASYSPAMTDWVLMVKISSHMYITGPDVIHAAIGEESTHEDLGGALVHNVKSGNAHFACESEQEAFRTIRVLLGYMPPNNMEDPPVLPITDPADRPCWELDGIVPDSSREAYDMRAVIGSVVDNGFFLEPHALYAQNIIIAFARLGGRAVGIVANQPKLLAGCLDINAADKASRFVRFCDAFNIPLVTFVDVPGYLPGTEQEWGGVIRHGAKLLWSYAEATVPKITVIVRKAYGGAYIAMGSQHLGADMVLAWPSAEIAVMGAEGAVNVIYRREIAEAPDPAAVRREKIREYSELFYNPYIAAHRGYVDAVIVPRETRCQLIGALEAFKGKSESLPPRKHGNIPL